MARVCSDFADLYGQLEADYFRWLYRALKGYIDALRRDEALMIPAQTDFAARWFIYRVKSRHVDFNLRRLATQIVFQADTSAVLAVLHHLKSRKNKMLVGSDF